MSNKLREVFNHSEEQYEQYKKLAEELCREKAKYRSCISCSHCIHVMNYPGFVTAEECECDVGLQCDTVLDSVRNCPKWEMEVIR